MLAGLGSSPLLRPGHWPGWSLLLRNSGWAGLLMPSSAPPQCFQLSVPRKDGDVDMQLRNHVYKVPPPHLYHSLPPHPPTFLFSPCAAPSPHPSCLCLHWGGGGRSSCCQWPFPCNWSSPGVSGLPSSCFLKPCQVPGLLDAQGRNSPDAAQGPLSPHYFSSHPQKLAVLTQAQMNYARMTIFSWEAFETQILKKNILQVLLSGQYLNTGPSSPLSPALRGGGGPGTWNSFAARTPPGLAGVWEEGHPT